MLNDISVLLKNYPRPHPDEFFLMTALVTATRGTCTRRRVGCVLVDRRRHVLATGYNGPESGAAHCIDRPCPGADYSPGEGLDECEAIHAEMNALLQCPDRHVIHTLYCTTAPCLACVKLLLNTSCKRIVFLEDYPQASAAQERWLRSPHLNQRKWIQF